MGMRLLITTQAVDLDDPILGFFHRWILEFAKHCERVDIICLKEGRHQLPANVFVHSLGKEVRRSRFGYVFRFYHYIYALRHEYDSVFVHMNPEYVVLGGLFWRQWKKKIALWYVHRSHTWWLGAALLFADRVFTSATRSIPSRSKKIVALGHGIDTIAFGEAHKPLSMSAPHIVSIGRIAPIKHLETIIDAVVRLKERGLDASLAFVGEAIDRKDEAYQAMLQQRIKEHDAESYIEFRGSMPPAQMPALLAEADISINASPTGGIDKTVLESFAAGVPAFFCNESFKEVLGESAERFEFSFENAEHLAEKIQQFLAAEDAVAATAMMRDVVKERADVRLLVDRILGWYKTANLS